MQKYKSITSPDIQHDASNMITELILINREGYVGEYPWRGKHKAFWGKTVAVVRKLIKNFELDPDQLAFYVYRCDPVEIDGVEFAKAAVITKKLFHKFDLAGLVEIYAKRLEAARGDINDDVKPRAKKNKKSLMAFIKELETNV
jgi:hypothetical protein